jgi:FkbM family methyltransferase
MFKDIKAKHGDFKILTLDMYISRYLEKYGEWSEPEVDLYKQIVNKKFVVVEVGAHIGTHTVPIAKLADTVICYEPQRIIYQTLCHNIIKNNLTNVTTYMMGAGDENKDIQLNEIDYNYYLQKNEQANTGGTQIEKLITNKGYKSAIVKLDDHLNNLASLHFIKIDAEYMEIKVLKGAQKLIEKYKPVIYFEFDLKDHKELVKFVDSLGYNMYYHITFNYNKDNYNKDPEDLHPQSTSNMIFAIPKHIDFKTNLEKVNVTD